MPSRYRLFGARGNGKNETEVDGYDSQEFMLQGASVALGLIKEAAEFAPVPGLKQAADIVLSITTAIQNVRDNKEAWGILSDECSAFIAVVWDSYNNSSSKEDWPPATLRSVINDLVSTLGDIKSDVEAKQERSLTKRFIFSTSDVTKITEYRLKVRRAVTKFEMASHLNMNDAITHLIKGQDRIFRRLSEQNIQVDRTNTDRIVGRIRDLSIHDRVTDEIEPELLAPAQRYLERERQFFSGEKNKPLGRTNHRATVESDDEDEDMIPIQDIHDDSDSREWIDEPSPRPRKSRKSSHRQTARTDPSPTGESSSMGNNSASSTESMYTGDTNQEEWNFPPPQYSQMSGYPSPPQSNPATPGQPNTYNFPYAAPPFFQQYPGQPYPTPTSPPFHHGASQQHFFPGYFPPGGPPPMGLHPVTGLPYNPYTHWLSSIGGVHTVNHNSGNVTNNNIKNAHNTTNTTIYNGSKRHRK